MRSKLLKALLIDLESILLKLSENNLDTIMPAIPTSRAQPITLAHHLMAYFQMFRRDIERLNDCYRRMNVMPLGSGALASTTYPINRMMVAEELEFERITENSLDGVSDRDFAIELASCLSIIMVHLSRFSEEIILWSSPNSALLNWMMPTVWVQASCPKEEPGCCRIGACGRAGASLEASCPSSPL